MQAFDNQNVGIFARFHAPVSYTHLDVYKRQLDNVSLGVTLENGDRIVGETDIDIPKHDANIPIKDAFLLGGGNLNPRAKEAIENSDYVIIGPGDLYTSIVPNLLSKGMYDTIRNLSLIHI